MAGDTDEGTAVIRLLGTLIGSALAIALLLLMIGIPQFRAPNADTESAIVKLPLRSATVDARVAAPSGNVMDANPEVSERPADMPVLADSGSAEPAEPAVGDPPSDSLLPGTDPDVAAAAATPGWYTFWSPFRSEIAAKGFVARLQSVTGLDYRIDRLEPGRYEVAFAYADEQEIPSKLAAITAATGLELASR